MYKIRTDILDNVSQNKIIIIGDVMLDHYIYGSVDRISPEAPVPVVSVDNEEYKLGGAGNVASNINAMHGVSKLIGVAGDDQYSDVISQLLSNIEMDCTIIKDPSRPTTLKSRIIAQDQQVVRVDREDTAGISPAILERIKEQLHANISGGEIVIISDYGKGVICLELLEMLQKMSKEKGIRMLIDPKIINCSLYRDAFLLTPNLKEAGECAGVVLKSREDIITYGNILKNNLNLGNLLITLGANGMALFSDRIYHVPAFAQKVYDVTGAGDTVISTLAVLLASGHDLLESCIISNYAASQVVMELGAAVPDFDGLKHIIKEHPDVDLTTWD